MRTAADVLRGMEPGMGMLNRDKLREMLDANEVLDIIDLRGRNAWEQSRIPGSVQLAIQELPDRYEELLTGKERTVICVCNGSVQSAMALVFLRSIGYGKCFNLSGGFSGWVKAGFPTEGTDAPRNP